MKCQPGVRCVGADTMRHSGRRLGFQVTAHIQRGNPERPQARDLETREVLAYTATKPEDFQAAVLPLAIQFGALRSLLPAASSPGGGVTVIIDRELSTEEQTRVIEELVKLSDEPERTDYTAAKSDGSKLTWPVPKPLIDGPIGM